MALANFDSTRTHSALSVDTLLSSLTARARSEIRDGSWRSRDLLCPWRLACSVRNTDRCRDMIRPSARVSVLQALADQNCLAALPDSPRAIHHDLFPRNTPLCTN